MENCLLNGLFCKINAGLGIRSFQKNERSLHSFPFFMKERNDLCVLFRSLSKNGTIFAFFSVLYKRTF